MRRSDLEEYGPFCHGTSEARLPIIREKGLMPREKSRVKSTWVGGLESMLGRVYLGISPRAESEEKYGQDLPGLWRCLSAASNAASRDNSRPVLIFFDPSIVSDAVVRPDEDALKFIEPIDERYLESFEEDCRDNCQRGAKDKNPNEGEEDCEDHCEKEVNSKRREWMQHGRYGENGEIEELILRTGTLSIEGGIKSSYIKGVLQFSKKMRSDELSVAADKISDGLWVKDGRARNDVFKTLEMWSQERPSMEILSKEGFRTLDEWVPKKSP